MTDPECGESHDFSRAEDVKNIAHRAYDRLEELPTRKKILIGGLFSGFALTYLALIFSIPPAFYASLAVLIVTVAYYHYSLPINHRFDLGTREAEHQFGPYTIVAETNIQYDDPPTTERRSSREQSQTEVEGTRKMSSHKTRTVTCKAIDDDGDVAATVSDTEVVGHELDVFSLTADSIGDFEYVRSTEAHVRDVTEVLKKKAEQRVAHGGNDPGIKDSLEIVFGEEWEAPFDDLTGSDTLAPEAVETQAKTETDPEIESGGTPVEDTQSKPLEEPVPEDTESESM